MKYSTIYTDHTLHVYKITTYERWKFIKFIRTKLDWGRAEATLTTQQNRIIIQPICGFTFFLTGCSSSQSKACGYNECESSAHDSSNRNLLITWSGSLSSNSSHYAFSFSYIFVFDATIPFILILIQVYYQKIHFDSRLAQSQSDVSSSDQSTHCHVLSFAKLFRYSCNYAVAQEFAVWKDLILSIEFLAKT